ncbi:MAG: YHS domain protein [Desulfobacteraceae bacterium]|nr:MAG: YHS domain protein [Desulfobacteraceae bacterium]
MRQCTRQILAILFMLIIVVSCSPKSPVSPVNVTTDGLAIKGYDPVAYFTVKKAVEGSPDFSHVWNGAEWRFSTAGNRDLFMADPERYAPRYGGYCAYAVSQGKTADIDPHAWTVVEGRLYLNLNTEVQRLWERDREDYIRKADLNWPRIRGR